MPDTLLGFETTSPRPGFSLESRCRPSPLEVVIDSGVGVLVVALLWWWGVVFDLWIVVASIETRDGLFCVVSCM